MNIKALHAGGWHDIFLKGTIQNYVGMRRASPARADQRLLLGPWAHAETSPEGKIGDVTFGKSAVLDTDGTILRWFDYALKGVRNEYATGAPVRIFVMGENKWRDEQEFPLARTRYTNYYLRQRRAGRGRAGRAKNRRLTNTIRRTRCRPSAGGCAAATRFRRARPISGPTRAAPDVLVFSTPPLAKDLEVTGWVKATIYASSSAADTDFTALLADVEPSGYARFLTDGIVRARYREFHADSRSRSSPARSTNTPSTCGPPATFSRRAIASGCMSRAATFRASTGI